jgi:hypothetical protein
MRSYILKHIHFVPIDPLPAHDYTVRVVAAKHIL